MTAPEATAAPEQLWTRDFILVLISTHLSFGMYYAVASAVPLYVAHLPTWQIGLVVGAAGAASLVFRLPSGGFADRFGRRPFLRVSSFFQSLSLLALLLSQTLPVLLPLRVVWGIGMALYATAMMASLADVLPSSRRGAGMAWWGLAYTTAQLYSSSLGIVMVTGLGFAGTFIALSAAGFVNFLCAMLMKETKPHGIHARSAALSREALPMLGAFVTLTMAQGAMLTFLVLFSRESDAGDPRLYFLFFGITQVAGRWLAGILSDRPGRLPVVVGGSVVVGISMLMLWLGVGYYASALLFGAGFAFGHTGLTILTMDRAPAHARGAALATLTLAWDLGTFLGSLVLGVIAGFAGYGSTFAVAGALTLLSLPFVIPPLRARRRPVPAPGLSSP